MLRNLTPHPITFVNEQGNVLAELPVEEGTAIPRCTTSNICKGSYPVTAEYEVPVTRSMFGVVLDLPAEKSDVVLIVSRMVAEASSNRADLLFPNQLVRDETGRIIGCLSLGYTHITF